MYVTGGACVRGTDGRLRRSHLFATCKKPPPTYLCSCGSTTHCHYTHKNRSHVISGDGDTDNGGAQNRRPSGANASGNGGVESGVNSVLAREWGTWRQLCKRRRRDLFFCSAQHAVNNAPSHTWQHNNNFPHESEVTCTRQRERQQ